MKFEVLKKETGVLEFNYEELKAQLENELSIYKNVIFDETQIAQAKETKAQLNKIADAIEKRRKDLKKEFMIPYDNFKAKTDELCSMVNEVVNNINLQLNEFEDKRKEEKRKYIVEEIWAKFGYSKVKIEQIWDEKWLNKTINFKDIEEAIKKKIDEIETNLGLIDMTISNNTDSLKAKYLISLDLAKVLREDKEEKERKRILQDEKIQEKKEKVLEEKGLVTMNITLAGAEENMKKLLGTIKELDIKIIDSREV